jgi:hypothetical protein
VGHHLPHDVRDQALPHLEDVLARGAGPARRRSVELGQVPAVEAVSSGSRRTFGATKKIRSKAVSDACL